ncbi:hypothetical protein RZ766_005370 [Providencia rettgeri]|uniref:hypothetical protein n=1 Tax=Providencia rettgeri TaxID=587 RepID=UPI00244A19AB|nr:hypothetical protein [Providencia rettgeri]ELL9152429.1 hypothetical protein [Providencia rettgeri]MDH2378025.1 hypothetical protein [Providencia rettgeri]MDV5234151.1 hypothetical protein [Providencia rettgeri]
MTQSTLAPVVLFVYGRPLHTQRTIDALLLNPEASSTDLIVYSDHAKNDSHIDKICKVREIINNTIGFKSITLIKRKTNYGLAKNIIEGITETLKSHDKVIVLEDDLEVSDTFLRFMNDSLIFYENHDDIISISGFSYPIEMPLDYPYDFYFLRIPLCWGWATWKQKWKLFNKDLAIINSINQKEINYINFDGSNNFYSQAIYNYEGKLNTWFIYWYISSVINKKLSVFPIKSLVSNIGHDGTGENCSNDSRHNSLSYSFHVNIEKTKISENSDIVKNHKLYFKSLKLPFRKRLINKIKRMSNEIFR